MVTIHLFNEHLPLAKTREYRWDRTRRQPIEGLGYSEGKSDTGRNCGGGAENARAVGFYRAVNQCSAK